MPSRGWVRYLFSHCRAATPAWWGCLLRKPWSYCGIFKSPGGRREPGVSEEILVNVSPVETRVAVVDNGIVQELHIERNHNKGYVGNSSKGRLWGGLPGSQGRLVDLGWPLTQLVPATDIAGP